MFICAFIARSWQMQESLAKGIWKIATIESVRAFGADGEKKEKKKKKNLTCKTTLLITFFLKEFFFTCNLTKTLIIGR